jgi:glycosyltransferase involved in cell wall biosynthesis
VTALRTPDLAVAVTAWCDAAGRGECMPTDRLIRAAVECDRFRNVLVANPYRSAPVLWVRRVTGHGEPALPSGPGVRRQVTVRRLRRHDPVGRQALVRTHRRYARVLRRLASDQGMTRPSVITADPFTAAFGDFGWAGAVTYFAWDDWAAHPAFRKWWHAYDDAYRRLVERGVRVAAVSEPLLHRICRDGRGIVVPNAVDPREWAQPAPAPHSFRRLAPPRVLYVGALDERLDVAAVAATARRFPNGTVVLVGPVTAATHVEPLQALDNVVLTGPADRADVVAMVHAADVCVIPHVHTDLTASMSPLKLYEHLAGGRPVAATDLAPIRGVDDAVRLAADGEPFEDAVVRALERGPMSEPDRLEFIRRNCWEERMDRIFDFACAVQA